MVLSLAGLSCAGPLPVVIQEPTFKGTVLPHDSLEALDKHDLRNQCSRVGTGQVDSFWTPTDSIVVALEQRLPGFFESVAADESRKKRLYGSVPELAAFVRQYVGIVRGDRPFVYVNAWIDSRRVDERPSSSPRVQAEPVGGVCDGGNSAFGVEYDVRSQRFRLFRFNGQ